jgi:hypothetical protein
VKRISIILVALLLGFAAPSAIAQFGPPNVPAPLTQPDDPSTTKFEDDTGLSTVQLVLMFGGAIAIVAFIAWFIMRDARRAAPVGERGRAGAAAAPGTSKSTSKSAREREREKARKRNKAKAARNQRKRNRPH